MHLQNGCRNLRSYRSEECIFYSLSLIFTADNYQDLLCHHNGLDTHGICLFRNIVDGCKESLVRLDGTLSQIYAVSLSLKSLARLIKSNMSVMSQSQKLQVYTASRTDHFFISFALCICIRIHTVGQMGSLWIDIDIIKQIMIHKIEIALIILSRKTSVLVQIHSRHITKVQISFFIPFDQLLIGSNRSRTSSQSKYTIRFHDHLCRNDVCCLTAHVIVIFCFDNFHDVFLSIL